MILTLNIPELHAHSYFFVYLKKLSPQHMMKLYVNSYCVLKKTLAIRIKLTKKSLLTFFDQNENKSLCKYKVGIYIKFHHMLRGKIFEKKAKTMGGRNQPLPPM